MPDFAVHLLDVGPQEYGDAVLCRVGGRSILIDGGHSANDVGVPGHPSIPDQLGTLLGVGSAPAEVDLVVVSHAHADHIGCLPTLVAAGKLRAAWALLPDPHLAWGRVADEPIPDRDPVASGLLAALREEAPARIDSDEVVAALLADAVTLEQRYRDMIARAWLPTRRRCCASDAMRRRPCKRGSDQAGGQGPGVTKSAHRFAAAAASTCWPAKQWHKGCASNDRRRLPRRSVVGVIRLAGHGTAAHPAGRPRIRPGSLRARSGSDVSLPLPQRIGVQVIVVPCTSAASRSGRRMPGAARVR